jgi:histidine triad (HIT) family protein
MAQTDCLFCRIVAGDATADVVASDEQVVVFRDVRPQAPVHVLAIPRRHIRSAHELTAADAEVLVSLFRALQRVADSELLRDGYRIVTNVGPAAGQSVDHLHLHLLGGRGLAWPPG